VPQTFTLNPTDMSKPETSRVHNGAAIGFARALSPDSHEQAKRLLGEAHVERGPLQYEGAMLVVKPESVADPHQQARNLLARALR
jgi:hypothetical protein